MRYFFLSSRGTPWRSSFWIASLAFAMTAVFALSANQADASTVINTSHVSLPSNNLGLVLYHTFDGAQLNTTTSTDSSGLGNNGTLSGGPTKVAGKFGQALNFDGSDDYVALGNDLRSGDTSGSISVWVKPTNFSAIRAIFSATSNSSNERLFTVGIGTNGKPYLQSYYNNGTWNDAYESTTALTAGAWSHLVFISNGSAWSLYINGVSDSLVMVAGSNAGRWFNSTAVATTAYRIGYLNPTYSYYFKGVLDDIRVYNRVLSATEVANMYRSGSSAKLASVSNKGLVGYWRFNEGVGSTATDVGSYKHNGLLIPGASGTHTTSSDMWTTGKFSNGLSFDGTDDYVSSTDTGFPSGSAGKTIHAWVKTTTKKNYSVIFRYGTASDNQMFWMAVNSGGNITITQHGIGLSSFGVDVANGAWHQVDVTSLGDDYIIYIDGVAKIEDLLTTDLVLSGTASIGASYGGGDQTGYEFNGKIDDVRIYSRVLSPTEIMSLYTDGSNARMTKINTSPVSVLTRGLVGYWTFDGPDLTTTTASDRSNQNNNGTLSGGPVPVSGRRGQALKFDGVNDYVTIPNSSSFDSSSFSLSGWVKLNTLPSEGGYYSIFSREISGSNLGYSLLVGGTSGKLEFWTANGSSFTGLNSVTTLVTGQWYNIQAVYNGTSKFLYLNGVQENTVSVGYSPAVTSVLVLMSNSPNATIRYVNGILDDVRIYNRALSVDEVKQLYNMGK